MRNTIVFFLLVLPPPVLVRKVNSCAYMCNDASSCWKQSIPDIVRTKKEVGECENSRFGDMCIVQNQSRTVKEVEVYISSLYCPLFSMALCDFIHPLCRISNNLTHLAITPGL